jgi:hypothetical protein
MSDLINPTAPTVWERRNDTGMYVEGDHIHPSAHLNTHDRVNPEKDEEKLVKC